MNNFLNSVALINLYSSRFKLYISILYSSRLKAIFERTKVFKFCRVIYIKVFSGILLNSVAVFFFFFFLDSKTSFLIVNVSLPFCVNILRHCPFSRLEFFMNKYDSMLESNQFPKLLVLLLFCQPCRYEYYSIIDYHHFDYHIFLFIYNFLLWGPLYRC